MSLQCGIFGLPNVGKSTCLNGLNQAIIAEASNYPFCTIKPNRCIVPVPDSRLKTLAGIVRSKNIIPATVEFVDIAGLVKNASAGEGLGNQFLSHIRAMDALVHVVRCFEDEEIIHVSGTVDPVADIEVIDTELMLADLSLVQKIRQHHQKSAKSKNSAEKEVFTLLEEAEKVLNSGKLLRQIVWEPAVVEQLKKWEFLTIKPIIYLANVSEDGFDNNPLLEKIQAHAHREDIQVVVSCLKLESDLIGISEEEKKDLLAVLSENATGLGELIRAAHQLLGLQSFFTAGAKEVRAWTVPAGGTAFEAAGCIHSDFQRGFIAAEVVDYASFVLHEGIKGSKAAGKWRVERKDYVVQDGDVILFRFNV